MPKASKSSEKTKPANLRKQVAEILSTTFADIKASVGDKKFSKKVKKASKVLAAGAVKKKILKVKGSKKTKSKQLLKKEPAIAVAQ